MLLENDAFLTALTKLFERARENGTVTCVMKICRETNKPTPKGERRREPTLEEIRAVGSGYGVLVRASSGSQKVSTFVRPERAGKFAKSYQTIQLAYMDGLGAAERTKKKKAKAKAKAAAKSKTTTKTGAGSKSTTEGETKTASANAGSTAASGAKTPPTSASSKPAAPKPKPTGRKKK